MLNIYLFNISFILTTIIFDYKSINDVHFDNQSLIIEDFILNKMTDADKNYPVKNNKIFISEKEMLQCFVKCCENNRIDPHDDFIIKKIKEAIKKIPVNISVDSYKKDFCVKSLAKILTLILEPKDLDKIKNYICNFKKIHAYYYNIMDFEDSLKLHYSHNHPCVFKNDFFNNNNLITELYNQMTTSNYQNINVCIHLRFYDWMLDKLQYYYISEKSKNKEIKVNEKDKIIIIVDSIFKSWENEIYKLNEKNLKVIKQIDRKIQNGCKINIYFGHFDERLFFFRTVNFLIYNLRLSIKVSSQLVRYIYVTYQKAHDIYSVFSKYLIEGCLETKFYKNIPIDEAPIYIYKIL